MVKTAKLIKKANNAPSGMSFAELISLAQKFGFILRNQTGSHKIFKHEKKGLLLNLQPDKKDKSKAKPYQVKELLKIINQHKLTEG